MKHMNTALAALAFASTAVAQTFTDCDPTKVTCPPDTALGVSNYTIDLTQYAMSTTVWNTTGGTVVSQDDGAQFSINGAGLSTTVQTNFKIFFGQVEVWMKAAPGVGVVSSIVLQSDDLDEVDWEWIGGNNSYVQTNYFGKGNTTSYDRAIWYPVNDVQGGFHNYTVDWSAEKLEWWIDGQLTRTLMYGDANGGHNFPQTPCDVRLGIWPGGDPKEPQGVRDWAGGAINYNKVPYDMMVKSVRVSDASTATQYVWGDKSGSWQSIQLTNTTKPIKLDGNNGGSAGQSAEQRWKSLSSGAKIAIGSSVAGVLLIGVAVFAFCCIKQRRAGKHERLIEDAAYEKNQAELMAYRAKASRERTEQRFAQQAQHMPMGDAGASFSPMLGASNGMSPQQRFQQQQSRSTTPHYAPSMHSMGSVGQQNLRSMGGSQRGYQKY